MATIEMAFTGPQPKSKGATTMVSRVQVPPGYTVADLVEAIRHHRDQRGDDRCWLDDQELYAVLGEGPAETGLPPRDIFLANCARFWQCRQDPSANYETVAAREQALKDEILRQRRIMREMAEKLLSNTPLTDREIIACDNLVGDRNQP